MSLATIADPSRRTLLGSLGGALFILSLGVLDRLTQGMVELPTLLPPFGASTVIVFFMPESRASRPWSVIVGHLGSALVACGVALLLPGATVASQASLAVAGASVWMVLSRSIHPPGGATALLLAISGHKFQVGAFVVPLLAGCSALVTIRWALDRGIAVWTRTFPTPPAPGSGER